MVTWNCPHVYHTNRFILKPSIGLLFDLMIKCCWWWYLDQFVTHGDSALFSHAAHDDPNKQRGRSSLEMVPIKDQTWCLMKITGNKTYLLHTIGHDYDHGNDIKLKCSLCNDFICYCCNRKNIHNMHIHPY